MRLFQELWQKSSIIRLGVGYLLFAVSFFGLLGFLGYFREFSNWLLLLPVLFALGVIYTLLVSLVRHAPGQTRARSITPEIEPNLAEYRRTAEEFHRVQEHLEDLVRERTVELAVLTDIGKALSSTLEVGELLQLVYEQTRRILNIENMYIALYDKEREEVEFAFTHRVDGVAEGSRQPVSAGFTGYIIRTHRSLLICGVEEMAASIREFGGIVDGMMPVSWLGVPMLIGDRVLGVITVQNFTNPEAYRSADQSLLEAIASQAAVALENARLFEETRQSNAILEKRAAYLQASSLVGQQVITLLDPERLLPPIVASIQNQFGYYFVGIWGPDFDRKWLVLYASAGPGADKAQGMDLRIPLDASVSSVVEAYKTCQPILMNDVRVASNYLAMEPFAADTQAELVIPLHAGEKVVGVLDVGSDQLGVFGSEDQSALETVATQVSIAIENARLYSGERRHAARQEALVRLSAKLTAALDENEVCQSVVDGLQDEALGYSYLAFYLVDEATGDRVVRAGAGLIEYLPPGLKLSPGAGISERALLDGKIHYSSDVKREPAYVPGLNGSEVDVPIFIGERLSGVLVIENAQVNAFGQEDFELLTTVASQAGLALGRVRLWKEAQQRVAELLAVNQVSQAVISRQDLQDTCEVVSQTLREIFAVEVVYFATYDSTTQIIQPLVFLVRERSLSAGLEPFSLGIGLSSIVIKTRQPLLINHDYQQIAVGLGARQIAPEAPKSWLGVPILFGDEVIGVVTVQSLQTENRFSDADVRLLTTIAANLGAAIQNAKLFDEAQKELAQRKKVEDEIRHLNTELEQRVAERTAQLEAANKEMEAFSYSVSHDLRAPLRAIDGFSRMLQDEYADKIDDVGRGYIQRVSESIRRMTLLIDDLLKLSRLTRSPVRRLPIDLSAIARSITNDLLASQPERQVEFVIEPGLMADADPNLMRIVLENLISNAWKFTSKQSKARVEFSVMIQEDRKVFFVRDNGAGFNMDYAGKLFSPFQRLHSEQDFPGTGIGLATVQRIIYRHGGRVWAESAVDSGATFYFTL